jgi:hypothetical protein
VKVDTWPVGRAAELEGAPPMPTARGAPGAYPVPTNRGRWRLTAHRRQWSRPASAPAPAWQSTIVAELGTAYGRRLEQQWNTPAVLTFSVDGRSDEAALARELATDIYAWRWDDTTGADVAVFRGIVDHSEDQVSEQSHIVTFTAHDYAALLERRYTTSKTQAIYTATDQDVLAAGFVLDGGGNPYPNWAGHGAGSYLPIAVALCNPDGSTRGYSGVPRDRTYQGGETYLAMFDNLAKVQGGYDYDVVPETRTAGMQTIGSNVSPGELEAEVDPRALVLQPFPPQTDALRVFYPYQGVARSDLVLEYGANVATVARSVNSPDYANDVRVVGNKASSDPTAAQLASSASNADANGTDVGAWGTAESASDVSVQVTLDQRAAGDLALYGILVPSYTLGLRPGWYTYGTPNMGDTVPLVIQSGRLAVADYVRVVGIAYTIGDDGDEDVALTVGRPLARFTGLLRKADRTIAALARR